MITWREKDLAEILFFGQIPIYCIMNPKIIVIHRRPDIEHFFCFDRATFEVIQPIQEHDSAYLAKTAGGEELRFIMPKFERK